jgi:hypothetical protein
VRHFYDAIKPTLKQFRDAKLNLSMTPTELQRPWPWPRPHLLDMPKSSCPMIAKTV